MSTHREAELLAAIASAPSYPEMQRLDAELQQYREERRQGALHRGDLELGASVVRDVLTPVRTHERHTHETDWLSTVASVDPRMTGIEVTAQAYAEATIWFNRISLAVRQDRGEFIEQARGTAHHYASQFGEDAAMVEHAFLTHVGQLNKMAGDPDATSLLDLPTDHQDEDPTDNLKEQAQTGLLSLILGGKTAGDEKEYDPFDFTDEPGVDPETNDFSGPAPASPSTTTPDLVPVQGIPADATGITNAPSDVDPGAFPTFAPIEAPINVGGEPAVIGADASRKHADAEPAWDAVVAAAAAMGTEWGNRDRAAGERNTEDPFIASYVTDREDLSWGEVADIDGAFETAYWAAYNGTVASRKRASDDGDDGDDASASDDDDGDKPAWLQGDDDKKDDDTKSDDGDDASDDKDDDTSDDDSKSDDDKKDDDASKEAARKVAGDGDGTEEKPDLAQSGEAGSTLDPVEPGDPGDKPAWPFEMGDTQSPVAGGDATPQGAADVASVPTPGGAAGYPTAPESNAASQVEPWPGQESQAPQTDEWEGQQKGAAISKQALFNRFARFEAAIVAEGANMSQGHFEHIADSIATAPVDSETKGKLANHFADKLASTNDRFRRDIFVTRATKAASLATRASRRPFVRSAQTLSVTAEYEGATYKIVRMYEDDRPSKTVKRRLTLDQAQEHCRRDDTKGPGWFDGYDYDGPRPKESVLEEPEMHSVLARGATSRLTPFLAGDPDVCSKCGTPLTLDYTRRAGMCDDCLGKLQDETGIYMQDPREHMASFVPQAEENGGWQPHPFLGVRDEEQE